MLRRSFVVVGALALLSCSSQSSSDSGSNPNELDVRVAIPPADPKFIDFVGPEVVIPAGTEKMWCAFMQYTGPDTAFYNQDALQGKYGHHAVLLSAKDPKPVGTLQDCTDMNGLTGFEPFSIPEELPDGMGTFLPSGKSVIFQFHYVNTSNKAIRVRDVARLARREIADVKTWAAPWVTNTFQLSLAPRGPSSSTFDCKMDRDVDLVLVGGHMHEMGSSFELQVGADEASLQTVYSVDTWKPEFRDIPPVKLMKSAPMHIPAGTILRTTCKWNNPTDETVAFPREMCSTFGIAAGLKDPFVCYDGTSPKNNAP